MSLVNESDFDFYLRFAKTLVLQLGNPDDRILAAAWIQKLREEDAASADIRTGYLKLLLFVLQKNKLVQPFTTNPRDATLERLPDNKMEEIAKNFLTNNERHEHNPIIVTEYSSDLLEYCAAQEIPNFGVHVYYAISKEPITNWNRADKGYYPKSSIGKRKQSRAAQGDSLEKQSRYGDDGSKPESYGDDASPRRSPTPIKKIPSDEERERPTWGSNLLNVVESDDDHVFPFPTEEADPFFLETEPDFLMDSTLPELDESIGRARYLYASPLRQQQQASPKPPIKPAMVEETEETIAFDPPEDSADQTTSAGPPPKKILKKKTVRKSIPSLPAGSKTQDQPKIGQTSLKTSIKKRTGSRLDELQAEVMSLLEEVSEQSQKKPDVPSGLDEYERYLQYHRNRPDAASTLLPPRQDEEYDSKSTIERSARGRGAALFPNIQSQDVDEWYLDNEEAPDLDELPDSDEEHSYQPRDIVKIHEEMLQHKWNSLADAGIPATTPQHTPSPRRPRNIEEWLRDDDDFDLNLETMPEYASPVHESPRPFGLPKVVHVSPPPKRARRELLESASVKASSPGHDQSPLPTQRPLEDDVSPWSVLEAGVPPANLPPALLDPQPFSPPRTPKMRIPARTDQQTDIAVTSPPAEMFSDDDMTEEIKLPPPKKFPIDQAILDAIQKREFDFKLDIDEPHVCRLRREAEGGQSPPMSYFDAEVMEDFIGYESPPREMDTSTDFLEDENATDILRAIPQEDSPTQFLRHVKEHQFIPRKRKLKPIQVKRSRLPPVSESVEQQSPVRQSPLVRTDLVDVSPVADSKLDLELHAIADILMETTREIQAQMRGLSTREKFLRDKERELGYIQHGEQRSILDRGVPPAGLPAGLMDPNLQFLSPPRLRPLKTPTYDIPGQDYVENRALLFTSPPMDLNFPSPSSEKSVESPSSCRGTPKRSAESSTTCRSTPKKSSKSSCGAMTPNYFDLAVGVDDKDFLADESPPQFASPSSTPNKSSKSPCGAMTPHHFDLAVGVDDKDFLADESPPQFASPSSTPNKSSKSPCGAKSPNHFNLAVGVDDKDFLVDESPPQFASPSCSAEICDALSESMYLSDQPTSLHPAPPRIVLPDDHIDIVATSSGETGRKPVLKGSTPSLNVPQTNVELSPVSSRGYKPRPNRTQLIKRRLVFDEPEDQPDAEDISGCRSYIQHLEAKYKDLPDAPPASSNYLRPPKEQRNLLGERGRMPWTSTPFPTVIDTGFSDLLPSPIVPPAAVSGWRTPPRLRTAPTPKPPSPYRIPEDAADHSLHQESAPDDFYTLAAFDSASESPQNVNDFLGGLAPYGSPHGLEETQRPQFPTSPSGTPQSALYNSPSIWGTPHRLEATQRPEFPPSPSNTPQSSDAFDGLPSPWGMPLEYVEAPQFPPSPHTDSASSDRHMPTIGLPSRYWEQTEFPSPTVSSASPRSPTRYHVERELPKSVQMPPFVSRIKKHGATSEQPRRHHLDFDTGESPIARAHRLTADVHLSPFQQRAPARTPQVHEIRSPEWSPKIKMPTTDIADLRAEEFPYETSPEVHYEPYLFARARDAGVNIDNSPPIGYFEVESFQGLDEESPPGTPTTPQTPPRQSPVWTPRHLTPSPQMSSGRSKHYTPSPQISSGRSRSPPQRFSSPVANLMSFGTSPERTGAIKVSQRPTDPRQMDREAKRRRNAALANYRNEIENYMRQLTEDELQRQPMDVSQVPPNLPGGLMDRQLGFVSPPRETFQRLPVPDAVTYQDNLAFTSPPMHSPLRYATPSPGTSSSRGNATSSGIGTSSMASSGGQFSRGIFATPSTEEAIFRDSWSPALVASPVHASPLTRSPGLRNASPRRSPRGVSPRRSTPRGNHIRPSAGHSIIEEETEEVYSLPTHVEIANAFGGRTSPGVADTSHMGQYMNENDSLSNWKWLDRKAMW